MAELRRDLMELPWLYLETRRAAVGMSRLGTTVGGAAAERALPLNEHAARIAADVHNGIVGWVRITIEDLGADAPAGRLAPMCQHLAQHLRDLRKHEAIEEFTSDVRRWTHAMVQAINRPEVRRIPAGPCPNQVAGPDGTTPCAGKVFAVFPLDPEVRPHAACSQCADPDAEPMVGVWIADDWKRLGKRMQDRQAEGDRARQLALSVSKGRGGSAT